MLFLSVSILLNAMLLVVAFFAIQEASLKDTHFISIFYISLKSELVKKFI